MAEAIKGAIHSIETFGSVDGPGVRYIVFLKGCNMRCRYCHNPDTWDFTSADMRTADEILNNAVRYREYWGEDGGITVSGGDPLVQIDFVIDLFEKAKAMGISTCLDTSAQPFTREEPFFSKFNRLIKVTDTVLFDIKEIDDEKHKKLTGHTNKNILDCCTYLSEQGVDLWLRHVLVPGLTDSDEELIATKAFIDTLKTVKKVEILPYHTLALYKYEKLGLKYTLADTPTPTPELVKHAEELLGVR
ncbi:MAG: pyruvate formate lyase-activating protein [Oribacterium sp.]|nr:pyruvate formate lyase-activating protein [Oribacterium sp.]